MKQKKTNDLICISRLLYYFFGVILLLTVNIANAITDYPTNYTLGRLFTTPEQRHYLDLIRNNLAPPKKFEDNSLMNLKKKAESITNKQTTKVPKQVIMKGYVLRKNGKHTVWVNDGMTLYNTGTKHKQGIHLYNKHSVENGIHISKKRSNPSDVYVSVTGKKTVPLKPGQIYNSSTGQIIENYEAIAKQQKEQQKAALQPKSTAIIDKNSDAAILELSKQRTQQLQKLTNFGKSILGK